MEILDILVPRDFDEILTCTYQKTPHQVPPGGSLRRIFYVQGHNENKKSLERTKYYTQKRYGPSRRVGKKKNHRIYIIIKIKYTDWHKYVLANIIQLISYCIYLQ